MFKYNYVYKLTNTATNNVYYGVNSTNDLTDECVDIIDPLLKSLFQKYGITSFTKEIIQFFDTKTEAINYYSENISHTKYENINDIYCTATYTDTKQILVKNKNNQFYLIDNDSKILDNNKIKIIKKHKRKEQSYETREKRSNTLKAKKHQQGITNSQYGTCWLTNINTRKTIKIKKEDINKYSPDEWCKGRKIKK